MSCTLCCGQCPECGEDLDALRRVVVHDTVREVLRAAEIVTFQPIANEPVDATTFYAAVRAWIAAGRPGLEETK